MSAKQFLFSLVFKGDAASAKAAAKEAADGLDQVSAAGKKAETVNRGNAEALEYEAKATRDAAAAARDKAKAEKEARDTALGPAGVAPTPISLSPEKVTELRDRFVPLEAAQRSYAKELEAVALAERAGALSGAESAAARDRLRQSHEATTVAIQKATGATLAHGRALKLSAHEQRNLMFQANDTFQSLALGMPISQVALQQGPQIIQAFGGIRNTAAAATAALTPLRIAIGGVAAAALIGATSWNGYLKSVKEVDTAAAGLGRGMAGTRQELEAGARAGAEAAGISIKAARSMEAAFLRTGRIDSSNFAGIIGLSKDFAATIGVEANAAGAALSEMMADPAKGADTLYRQFGLIDAATMQLAKDLTAQNRQAEAQAVLIKALPGQLADAETATTALGRAWDFVARKASGAGDAIGGAIDAVFSGPTTQERLAESALRLQDMRGDGWAGDLLGNRTGGVYSDAYAQEQQTFRQLLEDRKREGIAEQESQRRARANRLTAPALAIAEVSPANETAMRERNLRNQIAALERAQGESGLSAEQQTEIARAIDAKSRALDGLSQRQTYQKSLDEIDIQLANERNPLRRAELALMQSLFGSADKEITLSEAAAEAQRVRNTVMAEAMGAARAQSADMRTELEVRAALNAQVAAGTITSAEANRLLNEELALHPLVAAAAQANGKEQADLNAIIAERRALTAELLAKEKKAQTTDFLTRDARSQVEELAGLRLRVALIGSSTAERQRALAVYEAEREVREAGLSLGAKEMESRRAAAAATADLRSEVERLEQAWGRVQSSAEAAIDGPIDALLKGDFEGALSSFSSEVAGMFADLAIKNPLKNAMLGTNYGTLQDVGGIGGIWDRLTGTAPVGDLAVSSMGPSVGSMQVTAGTVIIGGAGLSGFSPGAANANAMPGVATLPGGLPGPANVQSQVWSYFAGKGLQPHQISGIMGNVSRESAFNPLAVGDSGKAFGLFQHNDRAPALFDAIGGKGNLGNVQAQLDFAWKELMTTESGAFQKLMAAKTVPEATAAFAGFERPSGYTAANPMGADGWNQRLAAAETAMTQFSTTTMGATANLGTLGTGFEGFGNMLGQALSGGGAGGGGLMGALANGFAGMLGIPGFATGGWTGGDDPSQIAGVVHGREYVFDAAATARIGVPTLEAMRKGGVKGYATGGYVTGGRPVMPVGMAPASAPVIQFAPVINPVNNASVPLQMQVEETTDARGQRQYNLVMSDAVAAGISTPGGKADRTMRSRYGVQRKGMPR